MCIAKSRTDDCLRKNVPIRIHDNVHASTQCCRLCKAMLDVCFGSTIIHTMTVHLIGYRDCSKISPTDAGYPRNWITAILNNTGATYHHRAVAMSYSAVDSSLTPQFPPVQTLHGSSCWSIQLTQCPTALECAPAPNEVARSAWRYTVGHGIEGCTMVYPQKGRILSEFISGQLDTLGCTRFLCFLI